jgi:RES domain-containing protein
LLYPSTRRPGGTNIVLYPANYGAGDGVAVVDPEGALPTDPSSWRA